MLPSNVPSHPLQRLTDFQQLGLVLPIFEFHVHDAIKLT